MKNLTQEQIANLKLQAQLLSVIDTLRALDRIHTDFSRQVFDHCAILSEVLADSGCDIDHNPFYNGR